MTIASLRASGTKTPGANAASTLHKRRSMKWYLLDSAELWLRAGSEHLCYLRMGGALTPIVR